MCTVYETCYGNNTDFCYHREIDPNKESDLEVHEEHLIIPNGVEVYEINGPYFFGIATKFEEIMARLGDRPKIRIIRMRKVPFIDSTGIHNLTTLCEMSQKENIHIILSGVNERVHAVLENPDSMNCWVKKISVVTLMKHWKSLQEK